MNTAWLDALLADPVQAVDDLLMSRVDIFPYERESLDVYLLAILPANGRLVRSASLIKEPELTRTTPLDEGYDQRVTDAFDRGVSGWLQARRDAPLPAVLRLSAYAARVCVVLDWFTFFKLASARMALRQSSESWLAWLRRCIISPYRDPEFGYWQALSVDPPDDDLQFHWMQCVAEAGRTRSLRYLSLGLSALSRLPVYEEAPERNLQLQLRALVQRYERQKGAGPEAVESLIDGMTSIRVRNPRSDGYYRFVLQNLLKPVSSNVRDTVVIRLKLNTDVATRAAESSAFRWPEPPATAQDTQAVVDKIRSAPNLATAWPAVLRLLSAHEDYLRRTGDNYFFVRTLDRALRALVNRFELRDASIARRVFAFVQLGLSVDADNPVLWMLWEKCLGRAGYPERAQWVLWDMVRRFPDQKQCRVDLAQQLMEYDDERHRKEAEALLHEVLAMDAQNIHALTSLATLAVRQRRFGDAISHATNALAINPSNQPSVMLLAQAMHYSGDTETAISRLDSFLQKYPANTNAEGYLAKLIWHRDSGQSWDETLQASKKEKSVRSEADPTWRAFQAGVEQTARRYGESAAVGTMSKDFDEVSATERPTGAVAPLSVQVKSALRSASAFTDLQVVRRTLALDGLVVEWPLFEYVAAVQDGASPSAPQTKRTLVALRDRLRALVDIYDDASLAGFVVNRLKSLGVWFEGEAVNESAVPLPTRIAMHRLVEQLLDRLVHANFPVLSQETAQAA